MVERTALRAKRLVTRTSRDVGLFEWVQKCRNLNAVQFVSAPIRMSQPPAVKPLSVLKIEGRKQTSWAQSET